MLRGEQKIVIACDRLRVRPSLVIKAMKRFSLKSDVRERDAATPTRRAHGNEVLTSGPDRCASTSGTFLQVRQLNRLHYCVQSAAPSGTLFFLER